MLANLPIRTPTSRPFWPANSLLRSGRKQGGFGGVQVKAIWRARLRQNYFECGLDKTCAHVGALLAFAYGSDGRVTNKLDWA